MANSTSIVVYLVEPKSQRHRVIVSKHSTEGEWMIRTFGGDMRIFTDRDDPPTWTAQREGTAGRVMRPGERIVLHGGGGIRISAEPRGNYYSREPQPRRFAIVSMATPAEIADYEANAEAIHRLGEAGEAARKLGIVRDQLAEDSAKLDQYRRLSRAAEHGDIPQLEGLGEDADRECLVNALIGGLWEYTAKRNEGRKGNYEQLHRHELALYRALWPDPLAEFERRTGQANADGTPTEIRRALRDAVALAEAESGEEGSN